jgi:hypothetical protein
MMYVRYRGLRHQFAYYDCMGAAQNGRRGCFSVRARNVNGAVSQALLSMVSAATAAGSRRQGRKSTGKTGFFIKVSYAQA